MKKNLKFTKGIEVVGSAIIENPKGQILLVRSQKWHNKWTLPGGHLEPGENILTSQIREAQEETGLKLKAIAIVAWGELINSKDFYRPAHFIYFDIYCRTKGGRIRLETRELNKYLWVAPDQALKKNLAETYDKTIKAFIRFKKNQK
ncbi:NUDIX domain-containing protein [Candidatus Parcubacteria bacterium]|jgi:nucleoside triphosphatase|nr:MAG: NUDIX domain-containing protein [Candidatus Parcubacteria bacterium]